MRCPAFEPLIIDMKAHDIDKKHYFFNYNGFRFDTILSIASTGYEILVAIHTHNWGCVLKMDDNFIIEMQDDDYYSLRSILNLDWNTNHFNSATFLRLLSEHAPLHSNMLGVGYRELRNYLPCFLIMQQELSFLFWLHLRLWKSFLRQVPRKRPVRLCLLCLRKQSGSSSL